MPYTNPPAGSVVPPNTPAGEEAGNIAAGTNQGGLAGTLIGGVIVPITTAETQSAQAAHTAALITPRIAVTQQHLIATGGYDIASAILGEEQTTLAEQTNLAKTLAGRQQQGIEQAQYGITSTKYPQEQAQAALAYKNTQLANQRGAAASGTTGTTGAHEAQSTAKANYGWRSATIYRQQQLAALGQTSEQVGYGLSQEQLANSSQQLALTAQKQGVSYQQLISQLGYGLSQVGIKTTPVKYYAAMQGAAGTEATTYRGGYAQASVLGGLGPGG